jgi:hypothetical protein
MSTKYPADKILPEAAKIIDTWTANPDFKLGTLTLGDFTKKRDEAASANAVVETKRTDLSGLMNARDDKLGALHELNVRAHAGFKATYGADSSQYEQAGGTRTSERKPPTRKAKVTA